MELIEEDKQRGIIDKEVILDASYNEYVTYPKCGMSKAALKAINENKKRVDYYEFNKYNLSDRQRMVLFFLCGYIDDTA